MSVVTIRPSGTVSVASGWSIVGGATHHAVLSDSSDATYSQQSGLSGQALILTIPAPTIPGGRFIQSIRIGIRGRAGSPGYIAAYLRDTVAGKWSSSGASLQNAGVSTTMWSASMTTKPTGGAWTSAYIGGLQLQIIPVNSSIANEFYVNDVWIDVTYTDPPTAPTNVKPLAASTVTTDIPVLEATLAPVTGQKVKAEWQLATDVGFTTNLRTVTEANADLRTSGATIEKVSNALQLFQGTWYIRARVIDASGTTGPYSAAQQFTVSHPPSSTAHSPSGGKSLLYGATNDLSWTFTDPSPVDVQTAYEVIIEDAITGTQILDTGKVSSAVSLATVAIPGANKNTPLQWRVKTWDSDDVAGVYSPNQQFLAIDAPTIAITSPSTGDVLAAPGFTVTWTFSSALSSPQAAYRVAVIQAGAVVYDSTWINSTNLSHVVPGVLQNTSAYQIVVQAQDASGIVGSSSINVTTTWPVPDSVTFTVDSSMANTLGYVLISWDNSTPDPAFIGWRIYRRPTGTTIEELIASIDDVSNSVYHDRMFGENQSYEWAVVQVVDRFNKDVESPRNYSATYVPFVDHYWLIDPSDETYDVQLFITTKDSFTDEHESSTMHLIGKGRKTDYGDRLGIQGSLSAQIRPTTTFTAGELLRRLVAIQGTQQALYLRNPFGDVLKVDISDIQVERVAGVGLQEFADISFSYTEVI